MRFSPKADDLEMAIAASALESLLREAVDGPLRAMGADSAPLHAWNGSEASDVPETVAYLTPGELDRADSRDLQASSAATTSRITDPPTGPKGAGRSRW